MNALLNTSNILLSSEPPTLPSPLFLKNLIRYKFQMINTLFIDKYCKHPGNSNIIHGIQRTLELRVYARRYIRTST